MRVSPNAGFPDVEKLTLERTGKHVHWNQGTPEDDAAAKAVAAKLAGDLSVNDAVEIALLNNRGLQATFERLGVAQADLVQAGLLRNPLLDAEARFAGGGSGFHLGLAEDFLSVFFIPLRKRVAASEFEAAKLMVTGEVLDVAARARKAFYEAQASEQALDLRRTVFETTAASFDLSKRLHDAGNITLLDMSNDQAFYEQSKLDLAEAESEVLVSRERLNVLMGAWGHETEWKLTSKLLELPDKELSTNDVEKQAIASSLDLAAVKQQFTTVAARLGIVRPGLLFQDASFGPNAEKDLGGGCSVGPEFSIPLPLFDQGQAAIAGVRAMLRRTQEDYAALAIEIRSRARMARNRMLVARNQADHYRRTIIPLRERIVDETQSQYNGMLVSAFQLLAAKERQITAGGRYIESLRDYWTARTELEELLSGKLPGSEGTDMMKGFANDERSAAQQGGE